MNALIKQKAKPILSPDPTWGPHGKELKAARKIFFPERELHYLTTVPKCKHNCLIHSTEYAVEVYEQIRKFREIILHLEKKQDRMVFTRRRVP